CQALGRISSNARDSALPSRPPPSPAVAVPSRGTSGALACSAPRRTQTQMRGLYAIVDTDALPPRGIAPGAVAQAVLDAQPAAIQLRDKRSGGRRTLELLRAIRPLAARAGVPLYGNDRPDLALLARCDGVHLGQDDVPVDMARTFFRAQATGAPIR